MERYTCGVLPRGKSDFRTQRDLVRPSAELESSITATIEDLYYFDRLYGILSGLKP
jgi:hypothetical protein